MRGLPSLAFFLILTLVLPPTARSAEGNPPLFETREKESANLKMFSKWVEAVQRSMEEKGKTPGSCQEKNLNSCHYNQWLEFIKSEKGKKLSEKITNTNNFLNKAIYITDQVNWGVEDYWESPSQFLSKNGDCEDYAITKYFTLKELGIPAETMRIVTVNDLNLKVGHAILAVYTEGRILILDNQIKQVVDATTIKHYEPIYSINEQAWWRHAK
jgi:predicted transglutaminase-like cysteine proteinase